jgi:hypothetical protein
MISQTGPSQLCLTAKYDRLGGIEIVGEAEDLWRFSKILKHGALPSRYSLDVPDPQDASPYTGYLSSLSVECFGQKARIAREADAIQIHGPKAALESLAKTIEFLAASAEDEGGVCPSHLHIEYYYEGHPLLASDSEPLILTVGSRRGTKAHVVSIP